MTLTWKSALVGVALLTGASVLQAKDMPKASMDPLAVAPDMYSLIFENDRVRVMQVIFKPGQSINEHTHPSDHFAYVLEAGQLTISKKGVPPSVANLSVGQVLWIPAETHSAKNTGPTQIKLLVNELKTK